MSIIPNNFLINDDRDEKKFKDTTFCNYKKREVLATFEKSILQDNLENSCYWCLELLISGHVQDIWNILFNIYFKYVNIINVTIIDKLFVRYVFYLKIKREISNLNLRNNQSVRNYLAEIITILCRTKKIKPLKLPKINRDHFDINILSQKFKAKKDFVKDIVRDEDPQELNIILNEFYCNLKLKNFNDSLYWFIWSLEWDKINNKNKNKIKISIRKIKNIDKKYCNDFLWIFWEIILDHIKNLNIDFFSINIKNLYTLFKLNYCIMPKTKLNWFIINSIILLTNTYDTKCNIIDDEKYIIQTTGNINKLILKFKNFEKSNDPLHNEKLKILNSKIEFNNKSKEVIKKEKKKKEDKKNNSSIQKFNTLLEIDKIYINNHTKNNIDNNKMKQNVIKNLPSKKNTPEIIKEINSMLN